MEKKEQLLIIEPQNELKFTGEYQCECAESNFFFLSVNSILRKNAEETARRSEQKRQQN